MLHFTDKDGLDKWYRDFKTRHGLSNILTVSDSFAECVPDLSNFIRDYDKATEGGARDAVYAKATIAATKFAAPIYECAWASCEGMVARGLSWFESKSAKGALAGWVGKYDELSVRPPTAAQLKAYQDCAIKWRRDVGFHINENTNVLTGSIHREYAVGGGIVTDVKDMLSDLVRRRNELLGVSGKKEAVSDEHLDWVHDWLEGNVDAMAVPPWGSHKKASQGGHSLLSTGIVKLYQTKDEGALMKADGIVESLHDRIEAEEKAAPAEKEGLDLDVARKLLSDISEAINGARTLAEGETSFRAQAAQIDTVFSSYFWAYKAGVTSKSFPALSQFLFELGHTFRGKEKMSTALNSVPYKWGKGLLKLFASDEWKDQDRIRMHPGVLTSGRMSEMVACFGAIPVNNPDRCSDGCGSPKFILNYNTKGDNPCAQTIVQLFRIQASTGDYQAAPVVPSEHLLHQSLVGKKSLFQNASRLLDNAINCKIVPAVTPGRKGAGTFSAAK